MVAVWVDREASRCERPCCRILEITGGGVKAVLPRGRAGEWWSDSVCLTNDRLLLRDVPGAGPEPGFAAIVSAGELFDLCDHWLVAGADTAAGQSPADVAGWMPDGAAPDGSGETPADLFFRDCARCLRSLLDLPRSFITAAAGSFARTLQGRNLALLLESLAGVMEDDPRGRSWQSAEPATRTPRREAVDPAEYRRVNPAELAAILQRGGAVDRVLEAFEPREGQLKMLEAVIEAFNRRQHLMIEAGTGVGKTLAYLLPAMAWAELNRTPVVVSTHTLNLQSQLLDKDVPLMEAALGRNLKVALIKGRANYLCRRRLSFLLENSGVEIEADALPGLTGALLWAMLSESGELDDLLTRFPRVGPLLGLLVSSADECAGAACRVYRGCFLQRARARALAADLVIANHALVLAETDLDQVALPPYRQLILDEAHNIEDAATRHFSLEISSRRLRSLLRRLRRSAGARSGGVLASISRQLPAAASGGDRGTRRLLRRAGLLTEAAGKSGGLFFASLRCLPGVSGLDAMRYRIDDVTSPGWDEARLSRQRFADSLGELVVLLQELALRVEDLAGGEATFWPDLARDLRAAVKSLVSFLDDSSFVMAADDESHVYWLQPDPGDGNLAALYAAPLEVGGRLAGLLYENLESVVLCSATLSVNQNFSFMSARLGLDHVEAGRLTLARVESPFDYAAQSRLLSPLFLPEPGDTGAYEDALSAMLAAVAGCTGGRTLVLFTSYAMLASCASALAGPLRAIGIRLLAQGRGVSRDAITREFRRGGKCVLLGTQSFWEGVDVVGDALSCVVLCRLPFPALGDPLVAARCEFMERHLGKRAFTAYMLPQAVLKFRQGFGRLIRHRNDRGVVIVADRRLMAKNYGLWFRRDLACPVSRYESMETMISDIGQFLQP